MTMWRELPDRAEVALKSYDKTWCIHNTSRLASPTLMKLEDTKTSIRLIAGITCLAFFASCATAPQTARGPEYAPTASLMREARSANVPVEKRAADYLQAAAMTAPLLGTGIGTPACETYNAACGELTVLLRSSEGGRLWNQPLTLNGNKTYHLRLEPAGSAVWAPNYFTTFESPDQIKEKLIRKENIQEGVGGALVGVRIVNPPEKFMPAKGITAPVTATLDFHSTDATLALRRPAKQPMASVEGKTRPLAANFSAPINYYQPPGNLLLIGLMAGLRSGRYMDKTGLYFLQPYDPDRIPLVLVHGLILNSRSIGRKRSMDSKPTRKSASIINSGSLAIRPATPSSILHCDCAKSSAKVDKLYPNHRPYVVVGHSMGGMLTRMQVITVTKPMWEKGLGETAKTHF